MPALQIVSTLKKILSKCRSKTYPTITMLSLELNEAMAGMGKKVQAVESEENMANKIRETAVQLAP